METFVRKYYPVVLQYCRYHTVDTGEAEDLTQETFERFFRALSGYRHLEKEENYLYAIAGNLCRDKDRRKTELALVPLLYHIYRKKQVY